MNLATAAWLAILFPSAPEFLTRPLSVAIRVNGGPSREARFRPGSEDPVEFRLEKTVAVANLELRLIGRESAGKAMGIGEVELWLAPE